MEQMDFRNFVKKKNGRIWLFECRRECCILEFPISFSICNYSKFIVIPVSLCVFLYFVKENTMEAVLVKKIRSGHVQSNDDSTPRSISK